MSTAPPPEVDVVVVGSGPNGLAAAVTLARAGLSVQVLETQPTIGGGARTLDLGLAQGVVHDICSAAHPLALASPFFDAFDVRARGVRAIAPAASYAQPLDARARSHRLARSRAHSRGPRRRRPRLAGHDRHARPARGPGGRARPRRQALGPAGAAHPAHPAHRAPVRRHDRTPGHPCLGSPLPHRTGSRATGRCGRARDRDDALPGTLGDGACCSARSAHGVGWPIPVGGSQSIIDALVADLRAHGGQIITGHHVRTWRDVPPARAVLLDTTGRRRGRHPRQPTAARRSSDALRRFRHGDAAAKVDFVLSGPVPWRDPEVGARGDPAPRRHPCTDGGRRRREVAAGRVPEHPVTLVSDPSVGDPSRIQAGLRPLWAYAHVPTGDTTDPTELVTRQIERFAPGFRDVIVASRGVTRGRHAPPQSRRSWAGTSRMGQVTMPG